MNIDDILKPLSLVGKCAVAQSCTEEVITWLIHNTKEDEGYTEICESLFDNSNLQPYHLNLLKDASHHTCWLCVNRTEDPELLKAIFSTYDDISTLKGVARNKHTPDHILDELANNFYTDVVLGVANNQSTSASTLTKLSKHTETRVVAYVASNTSTPPDVLLELANHENLAVVTNAKCNPMTPTIASKVEQALGIEPGQDIVAAIHNLKKARNDAVDALDKVDTHAFNELRTRFDNFHEDVMAEIPHRFYLGKRTEDVLASLRAWHLYKPIPAYSDSPMDQIMAVLPEHMRKESVIASVRALAESWVCMRERMLAILEET